jgi:DNA-binding response OmpR family regulator
VAKLLRAHCYRDRVTSNAAVADQPVRVLVVEDDEGIASPLRRGLSRSGYAVQTVASGRAALEAGPADVVLLDLGLPDVDGLEVCRRLRASSNAAVIVVTARSEEGDRVAALDEGADDYLVKPFGLAELEARIRAVLRRVNPGRTHYTVGLLTVDPRTRRVTVGGAEVPLTPKEFDILECLVADPGRAISRHELLTRVWDDNWYGPTRVLDVHVAALRRKIAIDGLIETVYGHGFRLIPAAESGE